MNPFGEIVATSDRGTLLGNRGVLHSDAGAIRRAWQLRRWILCVLEFKNRRRVVMSPGCYTELFFLDEATGLAAGHRPCAECQRSRFVAFRAAWMTTYSEKRPPAAVEIDQRLHADRITADGDKIQFRANLDELPDGVLVTQTGDPETAHLLWCGELLAWSPAGYTSRQARPKGEVVSVLTPASTTAAIRSGYTPTVHPSATHA